MRKVHMLIDPEHPFKWSGALCGTKGGIAGFIWRNVDCRKCLKKRPKRKSR